MCGEERAWHWALFASALGCGSESWFGAERATPPWPPLLMPALAKVTLPCYNVVTFL